MTTYQITNKSTGQRWDKGGGRFRYSSRHAAEQALACFTRPDAWEVQEAPARSPGRPPLPEGEALTSVLSASVTEGEREAVHQLAGSKRGAVSRWVRDAIRARLEAEGQGS